MADLIGTMPMTARCADLVVAAVTGTSFDDMRPVIKADELTDGFRLLDDENALPQAQMLADMTRWVDLPEEHMPQVQNTVRFSVATRHMLRQPVEIGFHSPDAKFENVDIEYQGPSVVFYHGTIATAARCIVDSGGFIPGARPQQRDTPLQGLVRQHVSRRGVLPW